MNRPAKLEDTMPQYAALIFGADEDWTRPEHAEGLKEYEAFARAAAAAIRGGAALYPTATATTVRVEAGAVITTDGPFAETKEVLTGFYLLEADDLDAAIGLAAQIPAARYGGSVEVRPVIDFDALRAERTGH